MTDLLIETQMRLHNGVFHYRLLQCRHLCHPFSVMWSRPGWNFHSKLFRSRKWIWDQIATAVSGCRRAVGTREHVPPPLFGTLLNLISTRGTDYAHHITTIPPDFWTVRRVCKRNFLKIINLYRVNAPTSWESSISTENSTISTVNATQCDPGAGKSVWYIFIDFLL